MKIESRKLEWNAAPRTKMVNENYKGPTGGDKKVENRIEKNTKKQNDLMYKQKKTHKLWSMSIRGREATTRDKGNKNKRKQQRSNRKKTQTDK